MARQFPAAQTSHERSPQSPGRLFAFALFHRGRWWRLALSTASFIIHEFCEAAVPIMIGITIDLALVPGNQLMLLVCLAVLAVIFLALSWSYQRGALAMVRVYGGAEHDLRQSVLRRLLNPRGLSERKSAGEALSLVTSDAYRVAGVSWSIAEQGSVLAAVATSVTALLLISVPLGLGVLLGSVIVVAGMHRLSMPLEARGLAEQRSAARASEVAADAMAGLRVLLGMGAQREAARRYRLASAESKQGAVRAAQTLAAYSALSLLLSGLLLAAIAVAGGVLTLNGAISIGQLITVLGLAQYLQGALAYAGTFASSWSHKRASARRLHTFHAQPELLPLARTGQAESERTKTVIDELTADQEFPSDQSVPAIVLHSDSATFTVYPGELVGVVAGSPARARAFSERLGYRVPLAAGELTVLGADALDLGPENLRAAVTAQPHHGTVFSGSLNENLVPPGISINTEMLERAALDDVIEQVGGLDAQVGEAGLRLSGGQRQRLLLARALHSTAPVLVLDEPTTAIDSATERRIAEGLRTLGRTTVLVTDSPVLLRVCHRVVTLSGEEEAR
ncbi:ABC transporter transmembrane domain-containing protein [Psychromicrobium lacuslunae]|uniref:ABC transporter transmembrane domain-containing protein n=1 Tax=Psychromicrobium lacuslunae TaxID=1618207 RepID=UPI0005D45A2B|nr:ABC transporter ATP-binding protein [Psychromicrobium lacuslunae]